MKSKYLFSVFTKGNTARLFFTELEDILQIQEDVRELLILSNNVRVYFRHFEHLITPSKIDILNNESYITTKKPMSTMNDGPIPIISSLLDNEIKKFNFSEKTYLDFSLGANEELIALNLSKIHEEYKFKVLLKMIIDNEIPLLSAAMSNRQDIQMSMIKENNLCKFLLSLLSPGPKIYFGKDIEEVKSELERFKINYTKNITSTN